MVSQRRDFVYVQYMRAIAALMVVLHHARNPKSWLYNPLEDYYALAYGVDIFFVISGFIMFFAARNENGVDFLGKRIIRVVPLYWVATIMLLILNLGYDVLSLDHGYYLYLLKSLFFIPQYSLDHPDQLYPYLVPGWTLNYEMLFYLIFFFGLMFRRTLFVLNVTILLLLFTGLFFMPQGAIMKFYTRPVILEFLCGVWIGYAYVNGLVRSDFVILMFVGFFGLLLLPFIGNNDVRTVGRIAFSSMIVIGSVSIGEKATFNKFLNLLGDSSYSIYLTHAFISLRLSEKIWRRVDVDGLMQFIGWSILSLSISSLIGVIVHLYFEKPVLGWLRKNWKKMMIRYLRKGEYEKQSFV